MFNPTVSLRSHLAALSLSLASLSAQAGPVLFVSDSTTDTSIATVLTGAGYTVTSLTNQYVSATGATTALLGSLGSYSAIFWSATGNGFGDQNNNAAMLANLSSYVSGGGRIFVTGYDSIASPDDAALQAFLGGSGSVDTCGIPGVISSTANSLTSGVENITGQTPGTGGNTCDRDGLTNLAGDTVGIVEDTSNLGFYQWTLRSLGSGQIAYVSNGNGSFDFESTTWTDSNSVYNAAVLNFAANASQQSIPEPSSLLIVALGLAGLAATRRKTVA